MSKATLEIKPLTGFGPRDREIVVDCPPRYDDHFPLDPTGAEYPGFDVGGDGADPDLSGLGWKPDEWDECPGRQRGLPSGPTSMTVGG
jgi:hypothetical protein